MLPIPNEKEVESFKKLYKERFGVELTGREALEVATSILQTFYLKHYPSPPGPDRSGS